MIVYTNQPLILPSTAIAISHVGSIYPQSAKGFGGDKSEFVEENAIQRHIAKLEDVNEHSKGRPKYLAHTRSPSDDGDFRWKLSLIYPIFMDTGSREGMVLIINYSVLVWKFLPEFLVKASVATGAKHL
ncbi:hypothetical protein Q3G72_016059 [Acer saccharum]|nr:hypothetical protein Q3G72_016059 [Acer saccharum]